MPHYLPGYAGVETRRAGVENMRRTGVAGTPLRKR